MRRFDKERIHVRDRHECKFCGSKKKLSIHHIKPRSYGGSDHPDNLMLLCNECHTYLHQEFDRVKKGKKKSTYTDTKDVLMKMLREKDREKEKDKKEVEETMGCDDCKGNCGTSKKTEIFRIQAKQKESRDFIRSEDNNNKLVSVVLLQSDGKWGACMFDKMNEKNNTFATFIEFVDAMDFASNWLAKMRQERRQSR